MNTVHIQNLPGNVNSVKIGVMMAQSYHHGALAEAMVEEALSEVRRHGVDQVSLRGIAQLLQVSPSAAYNHFSNKDDLLRAVGACGLASLDERMSRVLASHPANTSDAAIARFTGLGRAYLNFAIEETHLFQLTFGPICAGEELPPDQTGPYQKLITALDDLHKWKLLKPGIRPNLDLMVWAATHGMATLLVEGAVPKNVVEGFYESMSRLILIEKPTKN